jgi:hypothetical protein
MKDARDKNYVLSSTKSVIYFPNFVWAGGKQQFGPSLGLMAGSDIMLVRPIGTDKMFKIGESLLANLVKSGKLEAYNLYESSLNEGHKSKQQLFADLEKIDPVRFKGADLGRPYISDETYGRESMIYVTWANPEEREKGEAELSKLGHKVNSYDAKGKSSEVQVSYFKGWHWDI